MTIEINSSPIEHCENDRFEKHLKITDKDLKAIDLLAKHTDFSKAKLKQIMNKGAVWVTQGNATRRIRRATYQLKTDQTLHLYYDSRILAQTDFKARLIADEQDYSVWFKPAGMLSQGSKYGDHGAIYRWAESHIKPQRNAFLVHRLDKATSGLILIAHSKTAAQILSKMFSERTINKYYKAVVYGTPEVPQLIKQPLDNKKALTKIEFLEKSSDGQYSLLEIQILTGRKHQIRQHLAAIGHPIVGDRLYGRKLSIDHQLDLCLSAYKTTFISPFDQLEKHYELTMEDYPDFPSPNLY